MKYNGIVQGNRGESVIVETDAVYVHRNIKQIEENVFEYVEYVYGKDEYIWELAKFDTPLSIEQNKALVDYNIMMGILEDPMEGMQDE